jgi:hypothetical protein
MARLRDKTARSRDKMARSRDKMARLRDKMARSRDKMARLRGNTFVLTVRNSSPVGKHISVILEYVEE